MRRARAERGQTGRATASNVMQSHFYCHAAQSQVNMRNRGYLVERKSRETNAQRATSRFALFAQLLQAKSRCRKSFNVTRGFPQE